MNWGNKLDGFRQPFLTPARREGRVRRRDAGMTRTHAGFKIDFAVRKARDNKKDYYYRLFIPASLSVINRGDEMEPIKREEESRASKAFSVLPPVM
jgi:hypothetical protein